MARLVMRSPGLIIWAALILMFAVFAVRYVHSLPGAVTAALMVAAFGGTWFLTVRDTARQESLGAPLRRAHLAAASETVSEPEADPGREAEAGSLADTLDLPRVEDSDEPSDEVDREHQVGAS
ncbi:hypothetical protein ACIB24_12570 [Spongisporangium articulatum]|uniref:Uncharacterized protein n=1 Tax=Spongisporangium articulatum TaxID=3362603 RepID=A0ABW8AP58_9ACTN